MKTTAESQNFIHELKLTDSLPMDIADNSQDIISGEVKIYLWDIGHKCVCRTN